MTPSEMPAWAWALVGVGSFVVLLLLLSWLTGPRRYSLRGKVVLVTGGSSGIGKAIAQEAFKRGAHVALMARKIAVLEEAARELRSSGVAQAGQRVTVHAADVTDEAACRAAVDAAAVAHGGRLDVVVNSAGISQPRRFEDAPSSDFLDVYKLNVLGSRNAVAAALPHMAGRNPAVPAAEGGRIMFVSSQAGQAGLYGYTAYSASKFALQGFAQALQQELYSRNIMVSQCFPPDTDTPLLASENLQKPHVTKLLSESSATVSAAVVGVGACNGLENWRPAVPVGFDGWMLATLTSGMGPSGTLLDATIQVLTLGLWRFIALFYVQYWYRGVIAKHDVAPGPSTGVPAAAPAGAGAGAAKHVKSPLTTPLVDEDSKTK